MVYFLMGVTVSRIKFGAEENAQFRNRGRVRWSPLGKEDEGCRIMD